MVSIDINEVVHYLRHEGSSKEVHKDMEATGCTF